MGDARMGWDYTPDNDDDNFGEDEGLGQPTGPGKPQLPPGLRQHLKKLEKINAELTAKLEEQTKETRKASLSDFVKAKGYDPEVASFIPSTVEASEDAVTKWLEEKATLFAKKETKVEGQQPAEQPSGLPPEVEAALRAMGGATSVAMTPVNPGDQLAQVLAADTPEKLNAILRAAGNPLVN